MGRVRSRPRRNRKDQIVPQKVDRTQRRPDEKEKAHARRQSGMTGTDHRVSSSEATGNIGEQRDPGRRRTSGGARKKEWGLACERAGGAGVGAGYGNQMHPSMEEKKGRMVTGEGPRTRIPGDTWRK